MRELRSGQKQKSEAETAVTALTLVRQSVSQASKLSGQKDRRCWSLAKQNAKQIKHYAAWPALQLFCIEKKCLLPKFFFIYLDTNYIYIFS